MTGANYMGGRRNAAKARIKDKSTRAEKSHFGKQRILSNSLARQPASVKHPAGKSELRATLPTISLAHATKDFRFAPRSSPEHLGHRKKSTGLSRPSPVIPSKPIVEHILKSPPSRNARPSLVLRELDMSEPIFLKTQMDRIRTLPDLAGLSQLHRPQESSQNDERKRRRTFKPEPAPSNKSKRFFVRDTPSRRAAGLRESRSHVASPSSQYLTGARARQHSPPSPPVLGTPGSPKIPTCGHLTPNLHSSHLSSIRALQSSETVLDASTPVSRSANWPPDAVDTPNLRAESPYYGGRGGTLGDNDEDDATLFTWSISDRCNSALSLQAMPPSFGSQFAPSDEANITHIGEYCEELSPCCLGGPYVAALGTGQFSSPSFFATSPYLPELSPCWHSPAPPLVSNTTSPGLPETDDIPQIPMFCASSLDSMYSVDPGFVFPAAQTTNARSSASASAPATPPSSHPPHLGPVSQESLWDTLQGRLFEGADPWNEIKARLGLLSDNQPAVTPYSCGLLPSELPKSRYGVGYDPPLGDLLDAHNLEPLEVKRTPQEGVAPSCSSTQSVQSPPQLPALGDYFVGERVPVEKFALDFIPNIIPPQSDIPAGDPNTGPSLEPNCTPPYPLSPPCPPAPPASYPLVTADGRTTFNPTVAPQHLVPIDSLSHSPSTQIVEERSVTGSLLLDFGCTAPRQGCSADQDPGDDTAPTPLAVLLGAARPPAEGPRSELEHNSVATAEPLLQVIAGPQLFSDDESREEDDG